VTDSEGISDVREPIGIHTASAKILLTVLCFSYTDLYYAAALE
jgi:hypothetical protein